MSESMRRRHSSRADRAPGRVAIRLCGRASIPCRGVRFVVSRRMRWGVGVQGEADAERIRAEGARAAADMLQESQIAVDLARIERTGAALGDKSTLFFGADAKHLEGLFANPGVINLADR